MSTKNKRKSSPEALLKHAGKWSGDDLGKCLDKVYATRGFAPVNLQKNLIDKEERETYEKLVLLETIDAMSREMHFELSRDSKECHIYSRAEHMAACKSGANFEACNKCRIGYYRKIAEENIRNRNAK